MNDVDPTELGIGSALKNARRRLGMDVKEAEERTKIRARYLRALEAEDWEVLPAPAYVRGFLRTYGDLLGLDGDRLADQYRRSSDGVQGASSSPAAEPLLRERRRAPGSRPPSRTPVILAIAAGIIILLVILGSIGGDEGGDDTSGDGGNAARKLREDAQGGDGSKALKPVGITLEPAAAVRVCLVGDAGEALIDGQMLSAGAEESFDGFKTYRVDLPDGGQVELRSSGRRKSVDADGKASYEADSKGIREIDYAGPDCP
ncbi:MAG: helix-turn-helix domain-containing protein [Solirubrobacterales bacterium]